MFAGDRQMVRAYVEVLAGDATAPMTWQTFDDSPEKLRNMARIIHGRFNEVENELAQMNAAGGGIFVTVNETNFRGRTKTDIVRVRAAFIDHDAGDLRPFAAPPSIVVASAAGLHAYWLLDGLWSGVETSEIFANLQHRLALYYGSDPKVCDLPRVMRVPGFYHRKRKPRMVRLLDVQPHRYMVSELVSAHPIPPAPEDVPRHPPTWSDTKAYQAYENWAGCKELTPGNRNNNGFQIAAEGFKRGFTFAEVAAVVELYCSRAGILPEAKTILASAERRARKER